MTPGEYRRKYAGTDMADWDFDAICEKERQAEIKAQRLPRCERCGRPLWLNQPYAHYSCLPKTSVHAPGRLT